MKRRRRRGGGGGGERERGAIVDELRYEFSDNSIGGWQATDRPTGEGEGGRG